jgi:hypothetical protein
MIDPKPIDQFDSSAGARDVLTPRTFVRTTGKANLLLVTMLFAEFCIIAWVDHDLTVFRAGLWAVPIMCLITWAIAAVLHLLELATRALRALGRRLVGRHRSFRTAGSGVWDEWLDRPEPHDR